MIEINPFTALDQLLSNKGLEILKSKHHPTASYTWYDDDLGVDVHDICYTQLSHEEEESIQSIIHSELITQLENLIENLKNDVDTRTFNLNSDKERGDLCTFVSKRIEITIERWQKLPSSKNHPDSFAQLNDLKNHFYSLSSLWIGNDFEGPTQDQKVKFAVPNLPEGFKLQDHNLKSERLNFRQTALLFNYLKDFGAIINYDKKPLAEFIHLLTGHSSQSLRGNGFGKIAYIQEGLTEKGNYKKNRNEELLSLKQLLQSIIDELDKEIKANITIRK